MTILSRAIIKTFKKVLYILQ